MKYILDMNEVGANNAGIKPREDIDRILEKEGFKVVYAWEQKSVFDHAINTIFQKPYHNLMNFCKNLKEDDVVLMQWPLYFNPFKGLRFKKNHENFEDYIHARKIALIHDIESLRYHSKDTDFIKRDIERLQKFDCIIVHNRFMKQWLEENGLRKPMIELQLFDYLLRKGGEVQSRTCEDMESIVFAGNLNNKKSKFLYDDRLALNLNLYGVNYEESQNQRLHYKGSFPPDVIPEKLEGAFGLVWDGESVDTCSGNLGNYLRYNNPHKLSMYSAAKLPTIVWKHSALAEFVENRKIGFSVESLLDIPDVLKNMTQETYQGYVQNIEKVSEEVQQGFFTKNAVERAVKQLSAE